MGASHTFPIRKTVGRSHKGFRGWFFSRHSGRIPFESLLERDFLTLASANPRIRNIAAQPTVLHWHDRNGAAHRHVPDFAFTHDGYPCLAEIKPAHRVRNPRTKSDHLLSERTACLIEQCADQGILYRLITDDVVRREPALENARLLLSGDHETYDDAHVAAAKTMLVQGRDTPRSLSLALTLSVHQVYAMILDGHLVIADASVVFGPDSLLTEGGAV